MIFAILEGKLATQGEDECLVSALFEWLKKTGPLSWVSINMNASSGGSHIFNSLQPLLFNGVIEQHSNK